MNTVPDLNKATAMTVDGQTGAAKTPRLKLSSGVDWLWTPVSQFEQGKSLSAAMLDD